MEQTEEVMEVTQHLYLHQLLVEVVEVLLTMEIIGMETLVALVVEVEV